MKCQFLHGSLAQQLHSLYRASSAQFRGCRIAKAHYEYPKKWLTHLFLRKLNEHSQLTWNYLHLLPPHMLISFLWSTHMLNSTNLQLAKIFYWYFQSNVLLIALPNSKFQIPKFNSLIFLRSFVTAVKEGQFTNLVYQKEARQG